VTQLVLRQLNKEFEAKDLVIIRYHATASLLLRSFREAEVIQIPQSHSTKTDALSKLTSSSEPDEGKKIYFEILARSNTD